MPRRIYGRSQLVGSEIGERWVIADQRRFKPSHVEGPSKRQGMGERPSETSVSVEFIRELNLNIRWRINFGCRSEGDWGLHKVLKKLVVQRNLNR